MTQKTSQIIIVGICGLLLGTGVIIALSSRRESKVVELQAVRNEKWHYTFKYPVDDGKRIYKQSSLGEGITIDAGVTSKPGRYVHTIFDVTPVPIGSYRDNGARTEAQLEQEKSARPQDNYQMVSMDKKGATGFCYYVAASEIDKHLMCRYEYKGTAYYLGAENYASEENKQYFAGTGGDLLETGESIARSFSFLP